MILKERKLAGVFEIDPEPREDKRGFFMRTYDDKVFGDYGLNRNWVQENHSYSARRGTLRGLHFQFSPCSEVKLVRAVAGEIFVVFVDLRKGQPALGEWDSIILSETNHKMLYLPAGLALGMCTLTDDCTLLYKMGNYYSPENEGAIRWDDPELGIDWPVEKPILSEKDAGAKSFREFMETCGGLEV